jgi:hypothetical protein
MFAYESATGAFGTTSFGEYLPAWVQNPPDKAVYADAYARNEIPNRFVIPDGVSLCGSELTPNAQTICANASGPWHLKYRAFFAPGWVARDTGRAIPIS